MLKRRQNTALQSEIVSRGIGATDRNLRGHQLQDRRFVRVSQNKARRKKRVLQKTSLFGKVFRPISNLAYLMGTPFASPTWKLGG